MCAECWAMVPTAARLVRPSEAQSPCVCSSLMSTARPRPSEELRLSCHPCCTASHHLQFLIPDLFLYRDNVFCNISVNVQFEVSVVIAKLGSFQGFVFPMQPSSLAAIMMQKAC